MRLFARPMHELAGLTVDLDDVAGSAAEELAAACHAAPTGELCVRAALAWIDGRLAEATRVDPAIGWMLGQIRGRAGAVSIGRLRGQVGWSKTRLTSTFVEQVGVSPKQYARVMRFHHALRLIHAGRASLADVAIDGRLLRPAAPERRVQGAQRFHADRVPARPPLSEQRERRRVAGAASLFSKTGPRRSIDHHVHRSG